MFSTTLAVAACIVQLIGFALYYRVILNRSAHPKLATWSIWALVTILNFTSYQAMSEDWIKSAFPTMSSFLCILTLALALTKGEWKRIGIFDLAAFGIAILAAIWWWQSRSATYGHLILQAAMTVGFIPTIIGVCKKPDTEHPLPWFVWSGAFVLLCTVVILRWKQASDFLYPAGGVAAHALIGYLALHSRMRAARKRRLRQ